VDANRVQVTAGLTYSMGARFWANNTFRQGKITCHWVNAAGATVGSVFGTNVALVNGSWTLVKLENLLAPPGAVAAHLVFTHSSTSGTLLSGEVCPLDGVQVSPTEELPAYVDGSLGPQYGWSGAAHLSPGYRNAVTIRQTKATRGATRVRARLYLATKDGTYLEDITEEGVSGVVAMNIYNPVKLSLALSGMEAEGSSKIQPWLSYLAPVLELETAEGEVTSNQLGLFVPMPGKRSHQETYSTFQLEGRDLSWLLQNSHHAGPYSILAGENYIATAASLCAVAGLPASFPASSVVASESRTWSPAVDKLTILNNLLNAAGYYTAYPILSSGRLTSQPFLSLLNTEPALHLYSEEGGLVTGVVEQEGVYEKVANRIIVYKERPGSSPIRVQRTNNDPSSPTSTANWRDANGNPRVVTRLVKDAQVESMTEARALAVRLLEESASFTNKLKLSTLPLPDRTIHEVYEMGLYQSAGKPVATGIYWVDAWELQFSSKTAKMSHQLKRVETYGWEEDFS